MALLDNGEIRALVKCAEGRPLTNRDVEQLGGALPKLGAATHAHAVARAYESGVLAAPGTRPWAITMIAAQAAVGRPALLGMFVDALEGEPVPPPAVARFVGQVTRGALDHAVGGDDPAYVADLNRVLAWCDAANVATGVAW